MTLYQTLLSLWQYDISVMSQPWVYYTGFILLYLWFFVVKWFVLTMPVWLNLVMAVEAFRKTK